jgi:hypothetical protein
LNNFAIAMSFLREYVIPFLIFLVFLVALVAVSARIFLPSDMLAPAPIEDEDMARVDVSEELAFFSPVAPAVKSC